MLLGHSHLDPGMHMTEPFESEALGNRVEDLLATPTSQGNALAGAASALTVQRQAAC